MLKLNKDLKMVKSISLLLVVTMFILSCNNKKNKFIEMIEHSRTGDSINVDSLFGTDIIYICEALEYTSGKLIAKKTHINYDFDDVGSSEQRFIFKEKDGDFFEFSFGAPTVYIEDKVGSDTSSYYYVVNHKKYFYEGVIEGMEVDKYIYVERKLYSGQFYTYTLSNKKK